MAQLPSELWDHVLSYLFLPPDVVNALLVCQDFRTLIQANPLLVLALPRFDEIDSRQVVLTEDGRRARCTHATDKFPSYQFNTAFVRTRPTTPGRPPLAVVHFLIDFVPSTYFCVSVTTPLPKPQPAGEITAQPSLPPPGGLTNLYMPSRKYFIASHYSDGGILSYGTTAPYLPKDQPMARYGRGHVISVQVGLRDMRTASPLSPGWDRVVDVSAVDPLPAPGEVPQRHEVHPYVIFFKDFQMVHRPLVFPHLAALEWPLRVGTFFTHADQAVRIVAPRKGQRFRPLLPDAVKRGDQ